MEPLQRCELLEQHARLRSLIGVAVQEARLLRALASGSERAFALAVCALRRALAAHHAAEEAMLEPVLLVGHRPSLMRAQLFLEEHAAEHDRFVNLLDRTILGVAGQMDALAAELETHMQIEESTFLRAGG